jgi:hypothetical protein
MMGGSNICKPFGKRRRVVEANTIDAVHMCRCFRAGELNWARCFCVDRDPTGNVGGMLSVDQGLSAGQTDRQATSVCQSQTSEMKEMLFKEEAPPEWSPSFQHADDEGVLRGNKTSKPKQGQ